MNKVYANRIYNKLNNLFDSKGNNTCVYNKDKYNVYSLIIFFKGCCYEVENDGEVRSISGQENFLHTIKKKVLQRYVNSVSKNIVTW